jgi:hypothetical protein
MRKALIFSAAVMLAVAVGALSAFAGDGAWKETGWQESGLLLAQDNNYKLHLNECKSVCASRYTRCKQSNPARWGEEKWTDKDGRTQNDWCADKNDDCIDKCNASCPVRD